jgi:hypothetical protein
MADIYVDTNAAGGGDGSIESPYNVWDNAYIADGNNVYVKRGSTLGALSLPGLAGGSECTLTNYGTGPLPIIDGGAAAEALTLSGTQDILIDGFTVTNATTRTVRIISSSHGATVRNLFVSGGNDAIVVNSGDNVTIDSCDCSGFVRYGILVQSFGATDVVESCNVTDCTTTGGQYGVVGFTSKSISISGCDCSGGSAIGVYVTQSNGTVTVSDCSSNNAVAFSFANNDGATFYITDLSGVGTGGQLLRFSNNLNIGVGSYIDGLIGTGSIGIQSVDGMTFKNTYNSGGIGVNVAWSNLVFEGCSTYNSTTDGFSFVATSGNVGGVILRRCKSWGNGSGTFPNETGDGITGHQYCYDIVAEDCEFFQNKNTGAAFISDSTVTLRRCLIYDNGVEDAERAGVYIPLNTAGSSATIEDCLIEDNHPCELLFAGTPLTGTFTASNNEYWHRKDDNFATIDGGVTYIDWDTYNALGLETGSTFEPNLRPIRALPIRLRPVSLNIVRLRS